MQKHINYIEIILVFLFFLLTSFLIAQSYTSWDEQPKLTLDNKKNITYINPNTKNTETIFPVMLYSFNGWDEIKSNSDWNFLKSFGVNIVYSWDIENQETFIRKANEFETIVLLNHNSSNLASYFFSFPEEPIGAGTATLKDLFEINKKINKGALKFINVDVGPYYERQQNELNKNINIFKSKSICKWCSQGKGSSLSYDESVQYSEIVSFDYYPFKANGIIGDNVGINGKTSVGKFTKLLKQQYPDKSIWAVIQTMWFNPFNDKYQGNLINARIIRNLTFDAIINGADGISFFGHGQTKEYQQKKGYEFLKNKDVEIWKATLLQTFELGQLQKQYDSILLEDNIYNFIDKENGYSFSIKKVLNQDKYYFFVVNHNNDLNNIKLQFPESLKSLLNQKIQKIGNYKLPELEKVWKEEQVNLIRQLQIISNNNGVLNIKLDKYSVGIFSISIK